MGRKIKSWKDNVKGVTLVELIVSFALLGVFMMAASFVLTSGIRMYYRIQSTSNAVTVSDLILDKIVGEIAAADVEREGKTTGYYFWLGDHSKGEDWVAFCNRSGSPISIFADENGKLVVRYYEVTDGGIVGNVAVKPVQEIDWQFDDNVYMGYNITQLTFTRPQPYTHPNVLRVDLTIENSRTGFVYSAYRYGDNYNFDGSGNRFCIRNDGEIHMPSQAAEYTYPAVWESGGSVKPTDPVEPSYPEDPTYPDDPIYPVEPTDPVEPPAPAGSITIKDPTGGSHTLSPTINWNEITNAIPEGGKLMPNTAMVSDHTGFYVFFNSVYIGESLAGASLDELARQNPNKVIKITESTRVFTAADLVDFYGTLKWKEDDTPTRGSIAYMGGAYFLCPTEWLSDWSVPSPGNATGWILLSIN